MTKRINRDDVDKFYDYGLYLPTRTLYVGSVDFDGDDSERGTDHQMAERAIKGLHILDAQSSNDITIVMNNLGGDWDHGMAIYDAIRACRSRVTVKGTGNVMSMGAVILQAGDVRALTPNARVMIHFGSTAAAGPNRTVQNWIADVKRIDRVMEDLFLEKIREKDATFTRARLQKMLAFDTILTPSEAVALGLADEIQEI